jgi:predicted GTPase
MNKPKKRVFVSFDFDNDKVLKDFIVGQSRRGDSPFSVVDTSLKEEQPMKTWEEKARAAIKRSDIVVVMVGPKTHEASGVLKEVKMARDEGIKIVQVIGYKDGDYTAVPNAGRLYSWNWENLKNLLG